MNPFGRRQGSISRRAILWFGEPPGVAVSHELATRDLLLVRSGSAPGPHELASSRGAVFSFAEGDSDLGPLLGATLPALLDNGLKVCIQAASDRVQGQVSAFLGGLGQDLLRRTAPRPHELAQALAAYDPGPPARTCFVPSYASNVEHLAPEDALLLGRALHDTGDVVVDDLGGGLSKARVLVVRTTYGNSSGSWAQPFFAKIDAKENILREAENYAGAAPFVPFGLLPNIERVVLGHTRGLLLGNLVSASEPLWEVARRGQADQAIFNLFNTTLRAWRDIGMREEPRTGSVLGACVAAGLVEMRRIQDELLPWPEPYRRDRLRHLWEDLLGMEEAHRIGMVHGDLHANNVRVRGTDAILIDLAAAMRGPLVADFALLETWLAFALHSSDPDRGYSNPEWAAVVEGLYSTDGLLSSPPPSRVPFGPYEWIRQCVSVIRSQALECRTSPGEYRTTVIAALLRRAMFKGGRSEDRYRKKVAVELACKLASAALDQGGHDAR